MRAALVAAALALASPAGATEFPVCEIVVAADRPSAPEIYRHEVAHCNGWEHPDQGHRGRPRRGYQAPQPPAEYLHAYPGRLVVHMVPTERAVEVCGSYGCAFGGL